MDNSNKHLLYALILGLVVLAIGYFWSFSLYGGVAMIATLIVYVYYELKQEIREIGNKEEETK